LRPGTRVPGGAQVGFIAQREGGIARAHQLFGRGRQGRAGQERAAAAVERGAAAGAGGGGAGRHGGNYPRFRIRLRQAGVICRRKRAAVLITRGLTVYR
jgi:hypothetical protein